MFRQAWSAAPCRFSGNDPKPPMARSHPAMALWILQPGPQLALHFANYPGGKFRAMSLKESLHPFGLALGEFTQSPRNRFDHHVIAVRDNQPANRECPARIAVSASRFTVQRHRTGHRGAAPPAIF